MKTAKQQTPHILIVTGLSGAGKASVMRALEDLGYYCVDNLPIPLFSSLVSLVLEPRSIMPKLAIGIDARNQSQLDGFMQELELLKKNQVVVLRIIFVTAAITTLLKRFQETRRKHPLEISGYTITEAIEQEEALLIEMRAKADIVLDTDRFNIHEVRRWVVETFTDLSDRYLVVNLVSFGYKHGVPAESNLVFDVRSLPNPYFVPDLKPLTGKDEPLVKHLFAQAAVQDFWGHTESFLRFSLQKSFEEGRFFVTVAIGCTGGHHRSVAFVERFAAQAWPHIRFIVTHRDINR